METRDLISIIAIILAPLFAVQVQKWIELFREKKSKQRWIFHILMSTRMARLSDRHVEALNMIDIEFSQKSKKNKLVLDAWKSYLDQLRSLQENPTESQLQSWSDRKDELFIDLLFEMSHAIGYDFDKVHLKRSIYSPRAHGDQELEIKLIRENLVAILAGEKPIPMKVIISKDALEKQNILQTSLRNFLDGKSTVKVKIDNE